MLYIILMLVIPVFIAVSFLFSCFSVTEWLFAEKERKQQLRKGALWGAAFLGVTGIYLIVLALIVLLTPTDPHSPRMEDMVDLTGYDYKQCREIYSAYFELIVDSEQYDPDIPKGSIISHEPKAGVSFICDGNTVVRCVVSKGSY